MSSRFADFTETLAGLAVHAKQPSIEIDDPRRHRVTRIQRQLDLAVGTHCAVGHLDDKQHVVLCRQRAGVETIARLEQGEVGFGLAVCPEVQARL